MWFRIIRNKYLVELQLENLRLLKQNEELLDKLNYIKAITSTDITFLTTSVKPVNPSSCNLGE